MNHRRYAEAHPELSCTSDDEAIFEEYRAIFRSAADIIPGELQTAVFDDSGHTYFVTEPRKAESRGIAALHYSWANPALPGLALRSQLAADLAGLTIVNFPNNVGRETNEWYSRQQLRRIAAGDMGAIALPRMIVAAQIAEERGFERVHSLGWSEGAAIAGASGVDFSDAVDLGNLLVGEAPNVAHRSLSALARDFMADGTYKDEARVTGIAALSARYERGFWQGVRSDAQFIIGALARRTNRVKAQGFAKGQLETTLFEGMHRHTSTKTLLSSGLDSHILPPETARILADRVQDHFPKRATYRSVRGAHAASDDIRTHAVLVREAVNL